MRNPLVSIIVATYRRDKTLQNALNSLTMQTYKNIEIIVVDDNGEEWWNNKVADIINDVKTKSNVAIQYIANRRNQGSAKTRNIGIEAANGEYITFLDDDDIYLPEKIEKQINLFISENAEYGITDLFLYNEYDSLIDKRIRFYIEDTDKDSLMKYHLMYHMTGTDTMMFKLSYIKSIGGFDLIDVGDEFYLMQKAISAGGEFCYLPECHLKAYVHTGQGGLSSGEGKIKGENALYEYKKTFFKRLNKITVKYIRVRHYTVLSYAYIRAGHLFKALGNIIIAFIISPRCVINLFAKR